MGEQALYLSRLLAEPLSALSPDFLGTPLPQRKKWGLALL